jgi:hypothetical protein|tara:strand:+ start:1231 stop:1866 length:636 start_codon:yes stop_codon:yes gene_type:complete
MLNEKYIKHVTYGFEIFWLPVALPLILWTFFIWRFSNIFEKNNSFSFSSIFQIIMWCLPYVYVTTAFYRIWIRNENNDSFPWSSCLSLDVSKEQTEKGILGTYDYKCQIVQDRILKNNINSLVKRFYFINYGLFLIVIMIYNNTKKKIFKDVLLADWSLICLFLGLLTTTLITFDDFNFISIMFLRAATTNLVMGCASFGIVLARLAHVVF